MSEISTLFHAAIAQRVSLEIKPNQAVDVYRVAADLHEHYPNFTVDELSHLIEQAIIDLHGNAIWEKTSR